jgi:hypothetical protein
MDQMIVGAVLCGSLMTALALQKALLELLLRAISSHPLGGSKQTKPGAIQPRRRSDDE